MNTYLPLTEYSSKYRVSVSTLRRRIKAEDIQFMFEDGRYLILDEPMSTHQGHHRPSPKKTSDDSLVGATSNETKRVKEPAAASPARLSEPSFQTPKGESEEPILTAANRLLTELKKAYTQILQEKEEQILNLKAEVADLKTLVRVLEADNDRLRKNSF